VSEGHSVVRLAVVAEADATGETADIYNDVRDHFGLDFVPDVFQLLSTRPRFLHNLWETYLAIFDEGVLTRETKELIAVYVARDAGCRYCMAAHTLLAKTIGASAETMAAIDAVSPETMPVEEKVRVLIGFVAMIDSAAYKIDDSDIVRLRELGWTDAELLEAVWTACVFNAIVRLVDTVGLYQLGQLTEPRGESVALPTNDTRR
jgi:uncharacterized peroxidase-related enzyme